MLNNCITLYKFRHLLKHCEVDSRKDIEDIFDGSSFTVDNNSLTLYHQLYIDDFEPCNTFYASFSRVSSLDYLRSDGIRRI